MEASDNLKECSGPQSWAVWLLSVSRPSLDMAMGKDHGMHESVFVVPPESLVAQVEEERRHWISTRPADLVSNRCDDLDEIDDPGSRGMLISMGRMVRFKSIA
ncbi:hypothetical protein V6N13_092601 [Hibiscus sabdariffa]